MKSSTWVFQAKMTSQLFRPTTRPSFLRKSLKPDSLDSPLAMGKCASVSSHIYHENKNSSYHIGFLRGELSNICKEHKTGSCPQLVLTKCSCFSRPNTNSSHLWRIFYVAGTMLSLLLILLHFILTTTLCGNYLHSHFIDEKSEAQRTLCNLLKVTH